MPRNEIEIAETTPTRGVVLITGASKGIGQLCAKRLAVEGWRLFVSARTSVHLSVAALQLFADVCYAPETDIRARPRANSQASIPKWP